MSSLSLRLVVPRDRRSTETGVVARSIVFVDFNTD
jgi:hypothetical protein